MSKDITRRGAGMAELHQVITKNRSLLNVHVKNIVRLSTTCPFADVRATCIGILSDIPDVFLCITLPLSSTGTETKRQRTIEICKN